MDKKVKKIIKKLNRCQIAAQTDAKGNILLPEVKLSEDYKQDVIKLPADEMEKFLDEALVISVSFLEKKTFPVILTALYYLRYKPDGDKQ